MSIKRILAAAAASVVAVSAMAVSASAALASKTGNTENAVTCDVDFSGLTDDQISSITKIEAKITLTSDFVNGCIGYNDAEKGWTAENKEGSAAEDTWVLEVAAGSFAAKADDGSIAPFAQVQFWWVNDTASGEAGVVTLESVALYDADGNAVTAGDAASAEPESKPEESKTEESKTEESKTEESKTEEKPNVDTGVEGVAAVIGVAAVAAGALVVAKKRK